MAADLSSFQFIPRAVFNTATITGTYQALNGTGFGDDIKILKIYNAGTQGIDISYDGVTDHDFYPSGATIIIDLQTNHADNSAYGAGTLYGRKGQVIFGKGTAGTGNLYIIGIR
jgi:hypothetical protein